MHRTCFFRRGFFRAGFALVAMIGTRDLTPNLIGAARVPEGWFVWPAIEPIADSALDLRALNPTPAGARGFVGTRGAEFVTADGTPLRFWGANLSASVVFPPRGDIEPLARRLAKGGVNIARLHHLDNNWAVNSGGSLWSPRKGDRQTIDPKQLDRLHRLMAALKAQGIYSNLNLKVSKSLTPKDGFPATVTELPIFQKRVDIFDPRMIELQKSYARQLLTTPNPHTGLAPVDDPAVAIIEITNENSLLGFWTRDLGRGLDLLPEPFRGELARQWNAWLAQRYADDAALRAAWAESTATDSAPPIFPERPVWRAKRTGTAEFALHPGDDHRSLVLGVSAVDGIDWHAQAFLPGLTLRDGTLYTLEFQARADRSRSLRVGVGLDNLARPDETWRGFGLLEGIAIGRDWTRARLTFAAHSVAGAPAALQLNAGEVIGRIEIKDLQLHADAAGAGLPEGASPRAGTVPIPTAANPRQWADWIHFLGDTERAFAAEMRRFLREDLGVRVPIVGSQIEYGGLVGHWREQQMDFADTHAYWEHPVLPGGDFGSAQWTIGNTPQLAVFGPRGFGELGDRALLRVADKPYALSEYDHAAPTEFACEMYPVLGSFAARQGWNAVYPFDIGENGSRNRRGTIGRFFDQLNHPAKWSFSPFASRVFREALVPMAPHEARLELGPIPWEPFHHADLAWTSALGTRELDYLNTRYGVANAAGAATVRATIANGEEQASTPIVLEEKPNGRVYVIRTASAAAAIGFVGGADVDAGALRVGCYSFGRNFAAITALALDQQPLAESRRVLVTIVARAQNQGLEWNTERTSTGSSWGRGPPIVERVPATITLATSSGSRAVVYALAPDGSRRKKIAAQHDGGRLTFAVGPNDRTVHYEIVTE